MLGGALALLVVVGVAREGAHAAATVPQMTSTTPALSGQVGDQVVASVVETGVRTGASVMVLLQLRDAAGTVVAQTSGLVSEGAPLRVSYQATSAGGLRAFASAPKDGPQFSAAVLTIERWSTSPTPPTPPQHCVYPMPEPTPRPNGPVTVGYCLPPLPEDG
ncbi:Gmad2 immunoglobulin-like domain-containing protein [Myxococcus sp. K15C18031901]|uniref:Gmad2 immunoglobulin-like domain-containing protein n=1 Tax=Myxococcus dinghuensis TaxID=2906761 RepID=UPI0020A79BC4|nr:Gmad2 immunoglobulin-like domain-containing protein [Myxococcus dinghuensis]MCP3098121.1 Gmad2 immunoglobulin-like domain-containing protein [Myxococcus dinghuensis]